MTHFYISKCVSVKYQREVTPFMRKPSILLGDIGWDSKTTSLDLCNATSGRQEQDAFVKDARPIPLLLCFLTRQLKDTEGNDNRVLAIHSPDRHNCVIIRASDSIQATQWYVHYSTNCMKIDKSSKLFIYCNITMALS